MRSLTEPGVKMSSSDLSPKSRINLTDTPDEIISKIRSAVTDTGTEVAYDWEEKPGISNLLEILSFFTGRDVQELAEEHRSGGYGSFKAVVAEAVAAGVKPIREAYQAMSDTEVSEVMSSSAERARVMAEETMDEVREVTGLG